MMITHATGANGNVLKSALQNQFEAPGDCARAGWATMRIDLLLERTRESAPRLAGPSRLTVIPGAGHMFEEPGALGAVGQHVVRWLGRLGSWRRSRRFWS